MTTHTLEWAVDLAAQLSLPVKLAWVVWLVWVVAEVSPAVGWRPSMRLPAFRAAPPPPPRSVSKSSVRRPVARPVAKKPAVSAYGTSDFLAVLDEEQQSDSRLPNPS